MNKSKDKFREFLKSELGSKLNKDIVIIGKGKSVDLIELNDLANFIVINMNDSELIYPGDICVFHDSWVAEYFAKNEAACSLYITDQTMANATRLACDFVPYNPESSQFQMQRFFGDQIFLEKSLLMSALRIADEIGRVGGAKRDVFLLGVDLTTKTGYTTKILFRKAFSS